MSKGKAKVDYINDQGFAAYQTVPSWSFIYEASTIKSEKYNIGDRVVLPDGRVFRYAKSGGVCYAAHGAAFWHLAAVNRTTIAAEEAIGSCKVTVAAQTFTEDELRGGYVTIFGASNADVQSRGIIGNSACSGTTLTIYMDGPLVKVAPTTREILVNYNPYSDIRLQSGQEVKFAGIGGVPAMEIDAADKYFWLQTWGPCFCVATENLGQAAGYHQMVFNAEGDLRVHDAGHSTDAGYHYQHAGFLITKGVAGLGWNEQIVMLQISP